MIKIILDTTGGDHSPQANLAGAAEALQLLPELHLVLVGDRDVIEKAADTYEYDKTRIDIIHAPDVISCDDRPTDAIRMHRDSSLVRSLELLRSDDSISGMVTVGSTGVTLTGAVLRVGRLRGVERPAFCPLLPTMDGGTVGICDSGANADTTPDRLLQFALMGSTYMKNVCSVQNPRVALLNIGTEPGKGDALRVAAYEKLSAAKGLNFVGNMESRDLLSGKYDLVVCDGFSGNVLIKTTEGTCLEMLRKMKHQIKTGGLFVKLGALLMSPMFRQMKKLFDYQTYGGAVLLGTKKPIVKGHGSATGTGVRQCIIQAYDMANQDLSNKIENIIAKESM